MPVTAKLSKLFYERLGEQVASELVDWFNTVDATYRADLRELNELNFARSDAKLEQRLAQFEAKLEQRLADFGVKLEQRLAEFEVKLEQRLAEFEVKLERRLAEFEVRMERRFAEQTRWIFGLWATTMLAIVGLYFRG
jgi:CRP-like cAMP-binding protein